MNPWFTATLFVGFVLSKRFSEKVSLWRPFVMLGSFTLGGIAFVVLILTQQLSSPTEAVELCLSLVIGAAFGVGAGLIDTKDEGYLVRGEEPEEEVGR